MRSLQTEKVILLIVAVLIAGLFIGRTFLPYTGKATYYSKLQNDTILKYAPGELIIKFNSDDVIQLPVGKHEVAIKEVKVNKNYISDLNKKYKVKKIKKFANEIDDPKGVFKRIYKFELPDNYDIETVALEYSKDASVNYTMANYYWFLAQSPQYYIPSGYPDDVYYRQGNQWALYSNKLNTRFAWDVEKGNSSQVVIGIVDTGIDYTHPELAKNYIGGYDYESESGGDDNDPMDRLGHGTSVAGIIAASTNNLIGIAAGCPECKLYVVKVGSWATEDKDWLSLEGSGGFPGTMEDGARGIVRAADAGSRIISVSGGWVCKKWSIDGWGTWKWGCDPIENAVNHANNLGVLVVAAAGNTYFDYNGQYYEIPTHYLRHLQPATEPGVLTVAATDINDNRAYFSYYGRYVEVAAPGVGILTTDLNVNETLGFDYINYNSAFYGTSAATPHVSALAGLLWSKRPDLNKDDITNIITMAVDDVNSDKYIGSGRVNYARAMGFLDYNVLKNAPDYSQVIQRCCVANLDEPVSWKHDIDTTSYSVLDPGGSNCVNWDNFCSEWDTKSLPLDGRVYIGSRLVLRMLPSEKVYAIKPGPLTIETTEGLSLSLDYRPYVEDNSRSLANITYSISPKQRTYQWDLSYCSGTVDNDKDGWYINDNCIFARDCNDNYAYIQPGRNEYCGNNVDENCNGFVDEFGCTLDSQFPMPSYGGGFGGGGNLQIT